MRAQDITAFQEQVLDRYQENKRDLPWRDSSNGYHVLVSEVMSQQTQVNRVIPKFYALIDKAPDFATLAYLDKKALLTLRS